MGKTTLLLELEELFGRGAVYAAADTPAAALPGWWENLWAQARQFANERAALVLLDEVQYLPDWPRLLKTMIDEVKRQRLEMHVVATGSSALDVGRGSRETMAGRFERLRLLHWQATAIADCFEVEPYAAARDLVTFGGYPGAIALQSDFPRWRAYVNDSIVEPAIGRDLLAIERVRKPALLRQVFAVAVGHPAQIVSLKKIAGQLQDSGALETIAHYLHLLEEACLVAAVQKHSGTVIRRRSAPPKLVVLNNALMSSVAGDEPPSPDREPERWGRWVENACMAHAWNCGQDVRYWREEPLEVDLVTSGSWGQWAVEIKTGRLRTKMLAGVLEFCRRNDGFRPAFVCDPGQEQVAAQAGIAAVAWPDFLLGGLEPPSP